MPESMDRMIEMKVSFDTDIVRAGEDTRQRAAPSLPAEENVSVEHPSRWNGWRMVFRDRAASSAERAFPVKPE